MENDKLEIVRLKNLNEASKKTIGDLKKRIEDLMTENYELGKAKESKDVELENTKTENRRLQESVDLFNQMKKSISDKLAESKDLKSKQTETFQEIIKNLLVMVKAYQKYTDTVERSFVSSYENLLLLVDYKFDAIREAKKEVTKIELDPKQRKLLPSQSQSLVDVINEYTNPIDYDELDKIFSKSVKDLRGRKFLEDREANQLFESVRNTSGAPLLTASASTLSQDSKKTEGAGGEQAKSGSKGLSIPPAEPQGPVTISISVPELDKKMASLSVLVGDLKDTFEKGANADTARGEKFAEVVAGIKDLVGAFNGLSNAVQENKKSTGNILDEEDEIGTLKESLQDIKNNFQAMEDKCVYLSKIAGDNMANDKDNAE